MATKEIITNPFISLGGTDLSDEVASINVNPQRANVDVTTGGSGGANEFEPGLINWSVEITANLNDDMSTGLANYIRANSGSKVALLAGVAPTASAANPHLSGSVIVPELTIGGSVGGANNRTFTFQGTGARTWATS